MSQHGGEYQNRVGYLCVDNDAAPDLTLNKIYEFTNGGFVDDSGHNRWYFSHRFKSLDSVRDEKLQQILELK